MDLNDLKKEIVKTVKEMFESNEHQIIKETAYKKYLIFYELNHDLIEEEEEPCVLIEVLENDCIIENVIVNKSHLNTNTKDNIEKTLNYIIEAVK